MNTRKILACFCALLTAVSAHAATLTVNSNADPGDGTCDATECTLREAIAAADNGDTIDFAITGTITLDAASGHLFIDKSLVIQGPGSAQLALDGNRAVRLMRISGADLAVTVSELTLTRGHTATTGGGGIWIDSPGVRQHSGLVTISGCVITDNHAVYPEGNYISGGAINNESPGTLVIQDSTISSNSITGTGFGLALGAGVYQAEGTLTITNSSISSNLGVSTANYGGGVKMYGGTLSITGSTISNNVIRGETNSGGGVDSGSTLTISNSTLSNNQLDTTRSFNAYTQGGALTSGGPATITDSTFSGNVGGGIGEPEGGAISNHAAMTITNCVISGNSVVSAAVRKGFDFPPSAFGGAIYNRGTLDIVASRLTDNLVRSNAGNFGGAIFTIPSKTVNITGSILSGNRVESTNETYSDRACGGAIYAYGGSSNPSMVNIVASTFSGNTAAGGTRAAGGGAMFAEGAVLRMRNSTVAGNSATSVAVDDNGNATAIAGAIAVTLGELTITNSTVGNNSASSAATETSVIARGGGIYAGKWPFVFDNSQQAPVLNLSHSTVAGNAAGSGVDQGRGGGVFNADAAANVKNTIIAANTATSSEPDAGGVFVSGGYNLIGNGDGSTGFAHGTNGDQVGTTGSRIDPMLASLGSYGGPTQTFALQPGSPAYNAGDPTFDPNAFDPALTTDQHGRPRVRGGRLDIGAYEAAPPPVITAPANDARTSRTPLFAGTTEPFNTVILAVTSANSAPVNVVTIANGAGEFSVNSSQLGEGEYSVTAVAAFGSELASAPSNAIRFAVDATPPEISGVPGNITVEASGPNGTQVSYSNPTATDNVDGSVPVNCAPASGSTFSIGTTIVTCSASDAAGNTSTANFTVKVQDTTAPTISNVPANMTVEATGPNGAAVDYQNPTATDAVSGNVPVNCSPASGATFGFGSTTVTCTATDTAGNTATATFTVTVRDTTPPVITVPADIVVYNEAGKDGATVTFNVTATDTVSGSLTPTVNPASGSVFPIGTTVVTVTAQDAAGNTSTKTFEVTVRKTELANIATRVPVGTGEKVGIGGFIIRGTDPLRVIVRARGPSMRVNGQPVAGAMQDPKLDLYDSSGSPNPFASNDNWQDSAQRDEIAQSGLAPEDPREAAVIAMLAPGAYTGVLSGANGSTGNALVEVFALPGESNSSLVNISTRGPVLTADDLLIGGVIVRGGTPQRLVFRAIGPDLANRGVAEPLQDPRLELRDSNGDLIASNDNWQESADRDEIDRVNLEPNDPREAAIMRSLGAGDYTAVVRSENGTVGVGMVEVYRLE